jgi:hypothetical protein
MTKDCSQGKHYPNNGSFITDGGAGGGFSSRIWDGNEIHCGDKHTIKNSFGDVKPCQSCGSNRPSSNPVVAVAILSQVQQFFIANNVHQITYQNSRDLVISFNTNTNTNTTPPSQTITNEQLTSSNSSLVAEERTMWQNFKDYLKKTGKNKIDKQGLKQEIENLKKAETQKPASKTPLIVGGSILGGILIIVVIIKLVKPSKIKRNG